MPGTETAVAPPELATMLDAVERDHDARVLAARDIGSRAWGLADADSDHDVAALFVQRPAAYARLGGSVDTVERAAGAVDLTAWNVRRFAELLVDSNPTALEFCHSPVRYRTYGPLADLVDDIAGSFDPLAVYHHYRSLATRQHRKYLQRRLLDGDDPAYVVVGEADDGAYLARPADDPDAPVERVPRERYREATTDRTVKRALYVVRGVLYAGSVRATGCFPPLDFPAFLDTASAPADGSAALEGSDGPDGTGTPDGEGTGDVQGFTPDPDLLGTARRLAERKRAGEGDEPVEDVFEPAVLPSADVDSGAFPDRGIDRARVNAFVERSLADAPQERPR